MNERAQATTVEALLFAHRAELMAFVARRAGGKLAAEDVVQQAALRAIASAGQLRDPSAGRAWLFRITRSVLAEESRKPRLTEPSLSVVDASADQDEVFACDCVLANLRRLKPEHAAILSRVVLDGMPIADAASELGISANAATVRVFRAREALKQQLRSHCGSDSLRSCLDCSCVERRCCAEHGESSS